MTNADPLASDRVAEFHLLGRVDFDRCLALQRRLVYEAHTSSDRRLMVLLCEHPPLITVGRIGSRGHIRLSGEQLRRKQLQVRWVNRGGGCVLHGPGQLAIYVVAPLRQLGWTVGDYLGRLRGGILDVLGRQNVRGQTRTGRCGVWGRCGLLAAVGVSVQQWTCFHGAFLNVSPPMSNFAYVDSISPTDVQLGEKTTMSCLLAERRLPVRMTAVRAQLVESLFAAFSCNRYNVHSGHPWLRRSEGIFREPIARAS